MRYHELNNRKDSFTDEEVSNLMEHLPDNRDAPCNPATFRDHFKKALEEIPSVRVLTPHSCRHTYVSQMQALGVDLATIQSIVGHADVDMTQHYLHVQESIRQDAIARFSKAFTSETTDPDKPTDGACKVVQFPRVG